MNFIIVIAFYHEFHYVALYRASDAFVLSDSACHQAFQRKKVNEGDGHIWQIKVHY